MLQSKSFTLQSDDKFLVTGRLRAPPHPRFRLEFTSYWQARGINLWRGTLWLLRDGRRVRLTSVRN